MGHRERHNETFETVQTNATWVLTKDQPTIATCSLASRQHKVILACCHCAVLNLVVSQLAGEFCNVILCLQLASFCLLQCEPAHPLVLQLTPGSQLALIDIICSLECFLAFVHVCFEFCLPATQGGEVLLLICGQREAQCLAVGIDDSEARLQREDAVLCGRRNLHCQFAGLLPDSLHQVKTRLLLIADRLVAVGEGLELLANARAQGVKVWVFGAEVLIVAVAPHAILVGEGCALVQLVIGQAAQVHFEVELFAPAPRVGARAPTRCVWC